MSETNNYPDFYQPTEAHKPLEVEQFETSRRTFDDLFDDVMLRNMEDVNQYEIISGASTATLLKHIEVDGQKYTLSLEDRAMSAERDLDSSGSWRDSEKITRQIDLQRIDGVYGREYWSYRLGADGIVRRWDGGDMWGKRKKERKLGIEESRFSNSNETPEEIAALALANMQDLIEDGIPNARLEEDMGLNNQPVSPEELEGLRSFLDNANYLEP